MRFQQPVAIKDIAELIGAEIFGNADAVATGINEIHMVQEGDLVFVDHPKYYQACIQSAATYIIINQKTEFPVNKSLLLVPDPFEAYLKIVAQFRPFEPLQKEVSASSSIGRNSVVMPGAIIGNHVTIGDDCIIYPNAVIMDYCVLGNRVIIQSNTVIGSDAFYYNKKTNRDVHFKKMTSCGRVVLHDFVEIGANCTIDRGVTGDTVIGAGTKLDNLIHIAHDVVIGKNCLMAACVAIGGASVIEDDVVLWGGVGITKTVTVGKGAEVMSCSVVFNNLAGGKKYLGYPAIDSMEKRREFVWVKRIPELWGKVMGKK
ncbi:MAG: UDP-3-O-(3-hydroxymyristoyl)glucosamine N-acyltransferase [Bacteroidota bacterium]